VGYYLENIPDATISKLLIEFPFKDVKYTRQFEEGLRKAGLPE
jgi:hypothetical protein